MGKTSVKVNCIDQRLLVSSGPVIASGGHNEDEIIFSFCPLWDGYEKIATFYRDKDHVYHAIIESDKCVIPWEVLTDAGEFYFGVFGVKNDVQRTSHVVKYKVAEGAISEDTAPSDPTPDIYTQIISAHNDVSTRLQNHIKETDNPHGVKAIRESVSANARRIEALETYEPRPFEYVGNPVILENYENMPMNCVVSMLPIQSGSGDPSPENPRPVSGRTAVKVTTCGKNLCPEWEQGSISANGVDADANAVIRSGWAAVIPNTVYTISRTGTTGAFAVRCYDANKNYLGVGGVGTTTISGGNDSNPLNTTKNVASIRVLDGCYYLRFIDYANDLTNRYQLEVGSVATDYEPYQGETFTLALGQTVYGGILDAASGTLTVTHKLIALKDRNWSESVKEDGRFLLNIAMKPYVAPICDVLPGKVWNANSGGAALWTLANNSGDQLIVRTDLSTDDEWKAWLAANDPHVCYELETPETVQLSPTLIAALAGTNTLFTDGDSLTVSGRTDILWLTSNMIEQLSAVNEVTDTGAKAVSGAAVADYVAKQIATITDYEGVEF